MVCIILTKNTVQPSYKSSFSIPAHFKQISTGQYSDCHHRVRPRPEAMKLAPILIPKTRFESFLKTLYAYVCIYRSAL